MISRLPSGSLGNLSSFPREKELVLLALFVFELESTSSVRTVWVHGYRPVYKIQIHIIQPQALETLVKTLFDSRVVSAPQLRSDKDIFSLHSRVESGLETSTNFILITVAVC